MHTLKIIHDGSHEKVFLDDTEIEAVTSVNFSMEVEKPTTAKIELVVDKIIAADKNN